MKKWLVIGAAALQLLVLVYMAGEREMILQPGKTVYLRTAPIDPRDAFRGDYVRLDYEISHATTNQLRDGLLSPPPGGAIRNKEVKVYAALKLYGDLAALDYVSDRKPADADAILRGRMSPGWNQDYHILYGLEAYFVEQGKGLDLERRRQIGDIQIPLEMEVAVSGRGKGVLKGHRWSPLGIGLALATGNQQATDMLSSRTVSSRVVTNATVLLMNASSNDLAIVDLPHGLSLALEPDTFRGRGNAGWRWVGADQRRPAPTDADVRVLKPGEQYSIRIDLRNPQWFVQQTNGTPRGIGDPSAWSQQCRLFYRPPPADECRGLSQAGIIWHGMLPSRAFNGGGRID